MAPAFDEPEGPAACTGRLSPCTGGWPRIFTCVVWAVNWLPRFELESDTSPLRMPAKFICVTCSIHVQQEARQRVRLVGERRRVVRVGVAKTFRFVATMSDDPAACAGGFVGQRDEAAARRVEIDGVGVARPVYLPGDERGAGGRCRREGRDNRGRVQTGSVSHP